MVIQTEANDQVLKEFAGNFFDPFYQNSFVIDHLSTLSLPESEPFHKSPRSGDFGGELSYYIPFFSLVDH
jgi:hypothetical protein